MAKWNLTASNNEANEPMNDKTRPQERQAPSATYAAFMTPESREREICVANHFLSVHPEKFPAAVVSEFDFIACPYLGAWWERARELTSDGREWGLVDLPSRADWDASEGGKSRVEVVMDAAMRYSPHHIARMQRQLQESAALRTVAMEAQAGITAILGGRATAEDAMSWLDRSLRMLRQSSAEGWIRLSEAAKRAGEDYTRAIESGEPLTLPMPLASLQERLGGWPLAKLIMIQAITSGHKTTLARMAAEHVAMLGITAAYLTLEDTPQHIAARSLSASSEGFFTVGELLSATKGDRIASGIVHAIDKMEKADPPLWIRHESLTVQRCIARIYEAAAKGCKLIVVDFFQLLRGTEKGGDDAATFWANAAQSIQAAALETGACVLLCVQPTQGGSRAAEELGKILGSSDIRGGSAISQAAFALITLAFEYTGDPRRRVKGLIKLCPRKFKTAEAIDPILCRLDAAHDIIADLDPSQVEMSVGPVLRGLYAKE